ncbi:MAG: toxins and related Ca2+-binding protein-like protein, partial [Frankiales bacterium]|nr:toxins and related Ca2+-binding protein-like protein [Frankiales bacterium]
MSADAPARPHLLRARLLVLLVAMTTLGPFTLQATAQPASAAVLDPGITELRDMVDTVGLWTGALGSAGKMAEKVPLVGASAGGLLGMPDLVAQTVAAKVGDVETWGGFDGTSLPISAGDRDGTLTLTHTDGPGTDSLTTHLVVAKTLADQPFSFASASSATSPALNLTSAGGMTVKASIDLSFTVTVENQGGALHAFVVRSSAADPGFTVKVEASMPTLGGLSAAVGILGVTLTESPSDGVDASLHLSSSVQDPDGDGRLYVTEPGGADGELKNPVAAAGLFTVGFTTGSAGSIDLGLSVTPQPGGPASLPGAPTATVSWPDVSTGSPTVTAVGVDPVAAFLRLSPRDLADMLAQLASTITGAQRTPADLPLPFLSGTLADAVKGAETLVDFLQKNVVQAPPAGSESTIDPAQVGNPTFVSIQELVKRFDDYDTTTGHLAGAQLSLDVGTLAGDRLPLTLHLARTVAAPVDMVDSTIVVAGVGTSFTSTSVTQTSKTFPADLVGRRIVAGTAGGTVASASGDTITLADPWVGGTPAQGTSYAVSGTDSDAGAVAFKNLLGTGSGAARKEIVNANGITPTATVTPSYSVTLKAALDLSAPRETTACTGAGVGVACPYTRTNIDGTKIVVTQEPLAVDRLLMDRGYDLLDADFPVTAAADVYAKAGFLGVRVKGSVDLCSTGATATCANPTAGDPMLSIAVKGTGYVPIAEFFTALVTTPDALLDVTTRVQAAVTGTVGVPDADTFFPAGVSTGFTAHWADVTDGAPDIDVDDLSELLDFDFDSDPQALLGLAVKVLEKLDEQLAGGDGGGALGTKIPLLDRSLRDLLAADEGGGGPSVSFTAGTFDTDGPTGPELASAVTLLKDTLRTGGKAFPAALAGRSVVVGTQVALVLQAAGDTLTLTSLTTLPAAGAVYAMRSELADAVSLLTSVPPDSVQQLVRLLDARLGGSGLSFSYQVVDSTPSLVVGLAWDRAYRTSTPVVLKLDGGSLAGATGSAKASAAVTADLDVDLAVPLALPAGGVADVALKVLPTTKVALDVQAEVDGDLQANIGPLAISLGNPGDAVDATAKAHYSLSLGTAVTTPQTLSDFLAGASQTVNGHSGGVSCGDTPAGTDAELALCASLPIFVSANGTTWTALSFPSGKTGISLRLPKAPAADMFALAGAVGASDPRLRLDAPSAADLTAAFEAALLDYGAIGQGLDAFLQLVESALVAASADGKLPVIGDDLQAGADFVGELRTELAAMFAQLEDVNGGKLPDAEAITLWLNEKLDAALVAAGANPGPISLTTTCTLGDGDVTGLTTNATGTGTSYTYAVVATGKYSGSDKDAVLGDEETITLPTAVPATATVGVTFTLPSNATGYKIVRSTDGGAWKVRTTSATRATTFTDTAAADPAEAYTPALNAPVVDECSGVGAFDIQGVVVRVDIGAGVVSGTEGCADKPAAGPDPAEPCLSSTVPLDIGVPGLALKASRDGGGGGVKASVGWRLHLAFSLDKTDGFTMLTKDTALPELGVGVRLDLENDPNGVALQAELAFLEVTIGKTVPDSPAPALPPAFAGAFQIDINSGTAGDVACYSGCGAADPDKKLGLAQLLDASELTDLVKPQLDLHLNVDWLIKATVDAALPGIQTRLVMSWNKVYSLETVDDSLNTDFAISFEDVAIDAGGFLTSVLGPVVKEIKRVTGPVQPIIDLLYAPIPVLSDLSELAGGPPVTLVTLAKAFSTLAGGPKLDLVDTIASVITYINAIPTPAPGVALLIPVGSFAVASGTAWDVAVTPDTGSKAIKAGSTSYTKQDGTTTTDPKLAEMNQKMDSKSSRPSFAKHATTSKTTPDVSQAGFSFPILDDPSLVFGLIMGSDVALVEFDSGPLTLAFTWRQAFGPVYAPPPVFITLSGSASVTARIVAGFDTYGLRKVFEEGLSTGTAFAILDGLYFKTVEDDGTPIPVVTLYGEIAAGAAVSAVIITVGIEGGISLTIALLWNDPNADGKFRLFEFGQIALRNPLCLFQMSGQIALFLRVYITIGFSPFSVSFSFTLANITLLDFSITPDCSPPPPRLGGVTGTTLVVFAGRLGKDAQRGAPWTNADQEEEVVKVTQLHEFAGTDGARTATPAGVKVEMLGITETWRQADISRVVVDGTGYAKDMKITFLGDGDKDTPAPASTNKIIATGGFTLEALVLAGSGNDVIKTGSGTSRVDGGAGNDTITTGDVPASGRTTWIAGGPGDDSITTGRANAVVSSDGALGLGAGASSDLRLADVQGETGPTNGGDLLAATVGTFPAWDGMSAPGDTDAVVGNDRVAVGLGVNTVYAGAGDDAVGVAADSALFATTGDAVWKAKANTVVLGSGSDSFRGGSAADTVWTGPHTAQTRAAAVVDGDGAHETAGTRNTVDPGTGDDTVFGSDLIDVVTGSSRTTDSLVAVGGKGEDVLAGGFGTDALYGGPGRDWVVAEPAALTNSTGVPGELGTVARGYTKTPLPTGTAPSTKTLVGGDDADRIIGGDGASNVFGDRYEAAACGSPVLSPLSSAPVEPAGGSPGRDLVTGGAGVDRVKAGGQADKVSTFGADDLLCGQGGDDELLAGNDADSAWGGSGKDRVYGESGADTLFGNDGDDQLFGAAGADTIEGNGDADRLFGGTEPDLLVGGTRAAAQPDGADVLYGDEGTDTLIGDNGSDTYPFDLQGVAGAGGKDTLYGGAEDDSAYGGLDGDLVRGGSGADHAEGNGGEDTVYGEAGEDELLGGSTEQASAGVGRPDVGDTVDGGDASDVVVGDNAVVSRTGTSSPLLVGHGFALGHAVERLDLGTAPTAGTSGVDTLLGGAAGDLLLGGGQGDTLSGQDGEDLLEGGPGVDTLGGGQGQDDLVGGSSVPLAGATGTGQPDAGEVLPGGTVAVGDTLLGGVGADVAAGDNAVLLRTEALGATSAPVTDRPGMATKRAVLLLDLGPTPAAGTSGRDTVSGQDDVDVLLGQGEDDTASGGGDDDYVEGGQEADLLHGDLGNDDVVGGSLTARSGSAGTTVGQPDGADTAYGDAGSDLVLGDDATVLRVDTAGVAFAPVTDRAGMAARRAVQLFDLGLTPTAGTSAGDLLLGGDDVDVVLGQGGSDAAKGEAADDYVEGDQGDDLVEGGDGEDDVLGGGSTRHDGTGETLTGQPDGDDAVYGGAGADLVLGDNAVVLRDGTPKSALTDRYAMTRRSLRLLDLNASGGVWLDPVIGRWGSDLLQGGGGDDVALGQDGPDALSGGPGEDWLEGNGGVDDVRGDALLPDRALRAASRTVGVLLQGPTGADGQDDLIGGSSNL